MAQTTRARSALITTADIDRPSGMLYSAQQLHLRGIVHQQYTYYFAELNHVHKALCSQYKKLADIERQLNERIELQLTRKSKKKLQWSRALTRKAIASFESQQAWLHAYLQQCHDVLALYELNDYGTGFPHSLEKPSMPNLHNSEQYAFTMPQTYDDNSSVRSCSLPTFQDRRLSSSYGSLADSGFCEPATHPPPLDSGLSMLWNAYQISNLWNQGPTNMPRTSFSTTSYSSEQDDVPDLIATTSPIFSDTDVINPRKRRYSENAIQLIESRLPATRTHRRGHSVDHI